jgi:hypothetical protein
MVVVERLKTVRDQVTGAQFQLEGGSDASRTKEWDFTHGSA